MVTAMLEAPDEADQTDPFADWSCEGQDALFDASPALAVTTAPPVISTPPPARRAPRRTAARHVEYTFRRAGNTLKVTGILCDGQRHTVTVDAHGNATFHDHDGATLDFLRAMGNEDYFRCEDIVRTTDAARLWLDRRLRRTAPKGNYADTHYWTQSRSYPCCQNSRAGQGTPRSNSYSSYRSSTNSQATRNAQMTGHPGARMVHVRTVRHVASEQGVRYENLRKITDFMCAGLGISPDPEVVPDSSAAEILALLPAHSEQRMVQKLWDVGVTIPYMATVMAVYPAYDRPSWAGDDEDYMARNHALTCAENLMRWWRWDVTAEWFTTVGPVANQTFATAAGRRDWADRVKDWAALDAEDVVAYLNAGVTSDLTSLDRHKITPEQAAAFQDLARPEGGGSYTTLPSWLKGGYTYDEATQMVSLSKTARPVSDRDMYQVAQFLPRYEYFDRSNPGTARMKFILTLVGTPGRAFAWYKTDLPIEVIAQALKDGKTPAPTQRAYEKAQAKQQR